MSSYLGKNCKFFCGQWEDSDMPNYKEYEPVLVFCNHEQNKENVEGNCNIKDCPLINNQEPYCGAVDHYIQGVS